MYEAMEICSRTLQFFLSFFFILQHDLLSISSLVSVHDTCPADLQTSRRERVCGCWYTALRSAARITAPLGKRVSGKVKKHQKQCRQQTACWLSRLCRRWSKLKDKTRTAPSNSAQQWKDVLGMKMLLSYSSTMMSSCSLDTISVHFVWV